ncbi:MAG: GTPase Era [Clostridia bacterium]|nr:GTPase Era [Clostridia bacterium]
MTKTVFTAIVGCPNVGKSSLLNRILGSKVAIVTRKPQTTRTKITGVLTQGETQFVFTDTPGFHRPKNVLGQKMIRQIGEGISGMDACLFVTEPEGELKDEEKELLGRLKKEKAPVVLAINKLDTVRDKEILMKKIIELTGFYEFEAVIPVSAKTGENTDIITKELSKLAVESPHFFPDDTLTDQPERVIAAELIREKMLLLLDKEVPHGVAVSIEKMRDRAQTDLMDVEAIIYCEKESHKGIIIGKKGEMLKKISTRARQDMEKFFGCRINLQCWVKVKEDWRNREGLIRNFGLD